jgi:hypothetical protein
VPKIELSLAISCTLKIPSVILSFPFKALSGGIKL